mgnify:CR=1 FL=1
MGSAGRTLSWGWLGRVPYREAAALQVSLRERLRRGEGEEHLLLLEHPHVYTLGKSGDEGNLLVSTRQLTEKGAQFYRINRGGDITYHGPGQAHGLAFSVQNGVAHPPSLQNIFKMYKKLSGMTGTAMTEANEFWKIYELEVIESQRDFAIRYGLTFKFFESGRLAHVLFFTLYFYAITRQHHATACSSCFFISPPAINLFCHWEKSLYWIGIFSNSTPE